MAVVLVLLALILLIILVLIFGGAEERKRIKQEMKEEAKKQKQAKAELKRKNKEAKKQSKKYVDIFEEGEGEKVQEGVTSDAKDFVKNEEEINPSEINDILNENEPEETTRTEKEQKDEQIFKDMISEDISKKNFATSQQDIWDENNDYWYEERKEPKQEDSNTTSEQEEDNAPKASDTDTEANNQENEKVEFNKDLFGDFFTNDDENKE